MNNCIFIQSHSFHLEENNSHFTTLGELPTGARLIVQCKNDWRSAVVSAVSEEKIILQICSPKGRTYRKICALETFINANGAIPLLGEGAWQENFAKYDFRW